MRQFNIEPAKLERLNLWTAIYGESGSGKTYSALRLATGMSWARRGPIVFIDTENRKALQNAWDPKTKRGFQFQHLAMDPPFSPDDYVAAIEAAKRLNPSVIIIDSLSHEWDGEGGVLDMHEQAIERAVAREESEEKRWAKAERVKGFLWSKPKAAHKRFREALLRVDCHLITCLRAKALIDWEGKQGKKGQLLGSTPITDKMLPFEMTLRILLPSGADGVPRWDSPDAEDRRVVRNPEQFRALFSEHQGRPLSEIIGWNLALWSLGSMSEEATGIAAEMEEATTLDQLKERAAKSATLNEDEQHIMRSLFVILKKRLPNEVTP